MVKKILVTILLIFGVLFTSCSLSNGGEDKLNEVLPGYTLDNENEKEGRLVKHYISDDKKEVFLNIYQITEDINSDEIIKTIIRFSSGDVFILDNQVVHIFSRTHEESRKFFDLYYNKFKDYEYFEVISYELDNYLIIDFHNTIINSNEIELNIVNNGPSLLIININNTKIKGDINCEAISIKNDILSESKSEVQFMFSHTGKIKFKCDETLNKINKNNKLQLNYSIYNKGNFLKSFILKI